MLSNILNIRFILLAVIMLQFIFTSFSAFKVFKKHKYVPKSKDYAECVKSYSIITILSLAYIPFYIFVKVTGYNLLVGLLIAIANWGLRDYVLVMNYQADKSKT